MWGISTADALFFAASRYSGWFSMSAHGLLVRHLDCGPAGMFAVATNQTVWSWEGDRWIMPHPTAFLNWITVGAEVWGVSLDTTLWHYRDPPTFYVPRGRGFSYVSAGLDTSAYVIPTTPVSTSNWFHPQTSASFLPYSVPGAVSVVAVSDATLVLGIGTGGAIWKLEMAGIPIPPFSQWTLLPGSLRQIDVSQRNTLIVGVDSDDRVFYWNVWRRGFNQVPGRLAQVTACPDGKLLPFDP
jgi:hypothetical protein